ncbi:hypothetical protein [Bacterioplanoides sp. SCSIO 12839]|uniref:hypothetical protein n=1 Tax=Bacterioplanoides sp. SCSIO 12839 TaxID=2829569 RepID=UPI00210656C5|nr:hypothetical protein [Bacterioplanoides sp. SCSIO 12839]UTW47778.1 hypothetical protein KFF03_14585 [Bacterioplanoides sp. SCSIO 12839]
MRLSAQHSNGSALIISLVILTIITITSIVAMERSTIQLKMVGSMQRSQAVFNSTYDFLARGHALMNDDDNISAARNMLTTIINNTNPDLTFDPYATNSWSVPNKPNQLGNISGQITIPAHDNYDPNDPNPFNIKQNEGGNSETKYYFTFTAQGADKSGNITSSQEFGLYASGPKLQ